MDEAPGYVDRPFAFIFRYVRRRPISHGVILIAVLAAVGCSVTTQYGVKHLVDTLAAGPTAAHGVWLAFLLLVCLIAADNLLWRLGGWIASFTFVRVTGDLRRDLFRHLTGHSPSYFADRLPGMLSSRVTATSNAVFTVENMFVWNVLPPCIATLAAIAFVMTVSTLMAAVFGGRRRHRGLRDVPACGGRAAAASRFAEQNPAVDGEMVDVIGNMSLVRAFRLRPRAPPVYVTIDRELTARQRSLLYLERLRILHALVTVVLTIGLLAWAIALWQRGEITTGDVVLACTLGTIRSARDAGLGGGAHQRDSACGPPVGGPREPCWSGMTCATTPRRRRCCVFGASVEFAHVAFHHHGGRQVFDDLNLRIEAGQRIGLVGQSGAGK